MIDPGRPRAELRSAMLTLLTLPDRDARWLHRSGGWLLPVIHAHADAYGATTARVWFIPTNHDVSNAELISPALAKIRQMRGDAALHLLSAWAMQIPTWRQAQKLGCTPRTVRNRVGKLIGEMLDLLGVVATEPEPEPEPEPGPSPYGQAFSCPSAGALAAASGAEAHPGKTWVGDRQGGHWRKNGARWRDGQ